MSAAPTSIFAEMTALAQRTGAINLGQGFPDEDGPPAIVEAAAAALRAGHNQYAPLSGVPELRAAIAAHQQRRYGLAVDPDAGVQVTFGATEALAAALLALVSPGDEVLTLDPSYDSYGPIVRRAGGTPVPVALSPPGWRVEPEVVRAAVTPRTRVLLLNTPHNPTGRVLDRGELELLAQVCREHDLVALTDEVYERLIYDGAEHVPLATLEGMAERTVTVSSLGKTHGLTGWKVGWASGPPELIGRLRSLKQFLTFSGGTPLQHAAVAGFAVPDEEIEAYAAGLAAKRDRLAKGLRAAGLEPLATQGTYFLNATVPGELDAAALSLRLPAEAGVAAIPLSAFTAEPGRLGSIIRFAFCKTDETLDGAVERLSEWARERGARS